MERFRMQDLAQTVLEHVQTAALAVDAEGRVRICNPAAERILGVAAATLIGRTLAEIAAMGEPLPAVAEILQRVRRDGESHARREMTVRGEHGSRTIGYSAGPLRNPGEAAMIFADITETLLREQQEAEERRFAEVGRIASAMAHELKSPLATIKLYSELLVRELGEEPDAREQAEVVRDQARRCQERLTSILRSISPQSDPVTGFGLSSVVSVVRAVVRDQRRRFPGARITLRADAGDAVVGLAEPDLASLVGNLVGNALEVSGGKAPVTVSLRREARYVAMSVADRGPGLPEGDLFAPFFSTKAGGTGLGLWLVRRLVQAAGGEVAATNRQGGGAVFRVTLPVVDRDALQGRRVLLLEDDAALSAALTAALAGCGVHVCAHGAVAGALADEAAGDYDLAVLDFSLPDGDATAVAGALPADLPVLLMSGAGQAAGAAGRLPQRRVRFLGKPFALDDFLDLASLLVVKV